MTWADFAKHLLGSMTGLLAHVEFSIQKLSIYNYVHLVCGQNCESSGNNVKCCHHFEL